MRFQLLPLVVQHQAFDSSVTNRKNCAFYPDDHSEAFFDDYTLHEQQRIQLQRHFSLLGQSKTHYTLERKFDTLYLRLS